jgi:hypothetical protein
MNELSCNSAIAVFVTIDDELDVVIVSSFVEAAVALCQVAEMGVQRWHETLVEVEEQRLGCDL